MRTLNSFDVEVGSNRSAVPTNEVRVEQPDGPVESLLPSFSVR